MKVDTISCYILHEQVHDKKKHCRVTHAHIIRARLTACEVGVFSTEISQLLKIHVLFKTKAVAFIATGNYFIVDSGAVS